MEVVDTSDAAPQVDPSQELEVESVTVVHRSGEEYPGLRSGSVIAYDRRVLPKYRIDGGGEWDRCLVLADEGVQLTWPTNWPAPLAGGWYLDLVELETDVQDRIVVRDLEVDIVVHERGRRYEILDLDEFADAMESGKISIETGLRVLRQTQAFIDCHLLRPGAGPEEPWTDFPPAAIRPLLHITIPRSEPQDAI